MNLEFTYIQEGRIKSLSLTGVESMTEKLHKIEKGIKATFSTYGMQYSPLPSIAGREIASISEDSVRRNVLLDYAMGVFVAEERDIYIALAEPSVDLFIQNLSRFQLRVPVKIDSYSIIKILSLVPHRPIENTVVLRSSYDKREISLFRNMDQESIGDVVILPDTLSIQGHVVLDRVTLSTGGVLVVIDTDFREEERLLLDYIAMVDYASGSILNRDRYWESKYQRHNELEKRGFVHLRTEVIEGPLRKYVSAYMYMSDVQEKIERTYSIPRILRSPSDIFPLYEGVLPSLILDINYTINDLYSIDNPNVSDAISIYKIIEKRSRFRPPIYIDGGIGLLPISFMKYSKIYINTSNVQMVLSNLSLYRKGKITREESMYKVAHGHKEIYVGSNLPIPESSIVITTDRNKNYSSSQYLIVRTPIGTRDLQGERRDLDNETLFISDRSTRSYPQREMVRLVIIERIYNIFRELVPRGDFNRYLFDMITIGQSRGLLKDPIIPVMMSEITPSSLMTDVLNVPKDWSSFMNMVESQYPSFWDTYVDDLLSILPFDIDAQLLYKDKFMESQKIDIITISTSLHTAIHQQYKSYIDIIGEDIDVNVTLKDDRLYVVPNSVLSSIIGNRSMFFPVTEDMVKGKDHRDVASMLIRHSILSGDSKNIDTSIINMFGSPRYISPKWTSIYPDIDRQWGSLGSSMTDLPTGPVYMNPPYWNESMTDLLSKIESKVYLPKRYSSYSNGKSVILL